MKTRRFTDEQMTYALRQAERGTAVADVCRHWCTRDQDVPNNSLIVGDAGRILSRGYDNSHILPRI